MSRAFTKEDDAGEDLPERPVPSGPNYVTPRGLRLLQAAARDLADRRERARKVGSDTAPFERDLRYLEARVSRAIVVPTGNGPEARFGARVSLQSDTGGTRTYRIVGEDEARTDPGFLPWSSPLAQALYGARAGDRVSFRSAEGSATVLVLSVEYPNDAD